MSQVAATFGRPNDDGHRNGHDLAIVLRRSAFLTDLLREDRETVLRSARLQSFTAGANLFEEGQPCRGLWLLVAGRVRLTHSGLDGRQQIVAFRGPGSVLELVPVLDGRQHLSTAVAVEDVSAAFISQPIVQGIVLRNPSLLRRAVDELCIELRQRDIWDGVAALRDSRGRMGCALSHLAKTYGVATPDGVRIQHRLTRQDLADRAGVRLETAIRILGDFQREGIIRTHAQVIEITDLARLRVILDCAACQFDCSVFEPQVSTRILTGQLPPLPA